MPVGLKETRVARTYSLLDKTDEMIGDIAARTFRSKANVIDLAVAKLHAEVVGESEQPASPEPSDTTSMATK